MIAPKHLNKPVIEGAYSHSEIEKFNKDGYNIYYYPNHPYEYPTTGNVDSSQIEVFNYVFADMDLKDGIYASKEDFLEVLVNLMPQTSRIVDSGNGIHAYWQMTDLDARSYLRLQRRIAAFLDTDPATSMICQLMRLPGFFNTKDPNNLKLCETIYDSDASYTCEDLDRILPPISIDDEKYCVTHYNNAYNRNKIDIDVPEKITSKFGKLIKENHEVKELWSGLTDDRSKNDFRLGHIMFANGFSKEEAASVLVNSAKALQRAPVHRVSYATNIIDKIWTYELEPDKRATGLSSSIKDILAKSPSETLKGTPFRCHKRIDNTEHGFRLGQVIGLVAGSGVGKTAFALNMFRWFAEQNPDYHNFFIPLEQPANEIADRWQTMSGNDTSLHDKVHVMSNYDDDGNFRHLSLDEIKQYILQWQKDTGKKIGCIVIDHIGALKKKGSNDENQDLMTICHSMKSFAVQTNTLLIMQSQTSREKAGIGDLELNKDAAYGTLFFEAYCDYLITLWQPLKRCHADDSCPTVTAFKFCKIRHKKAKRDIIKEDVPYFFSFDSETELLRDMTQDEKTAFEYWLPQATNKRKADRKTELVEYKSVPYNEGSNETNSNRLTTRH